MSPLMRGILVAVVQVALPDVFAFYDEVLAKTMAQGRTAGNNVASPATHAMSLIHRRIVALLEAA